jgi:hypothetical protein
MTLPLMKYVLQLRPHGDPDTREPLMMDLLQDTGAIAEFIHSLLNSFIHC